MLKNKITILSTGILDSRLSEKAFDLDIIIDTIPFISTTPVAAPGLQAQLKVMEQQPAFIVFTSAKAVEAVVANLETHPLHWRFFCISQATRKMVHKYFGGSAIAATANSAGELAKEIINWGVTDDLLFFCGDHRRDELPDRIRESGRKVKEIVVYETILTPVKINQPYDGILFFSPSAVQSFFSMNQLPPETILFSIGHTTAAELENNTTNKIIIADKPEKEELLKKVIEYFNK